MKKENHTLIRIMALLFSFGIGFAARGETHDANNAEDLFDMSMEQLMEIEIVSASRQPHKMCDLSVPVSIITAEDIHYSGLTSIPEILQFEPGVDVIRLSRYRYAVGVRGLHDFISDRALTLINGRAADSPLFGGAEFYRLPILPEDIERIEVVRGPGGAAWGANAFTGVINIITKKPRDILGGFVSTNINEFGDSFTHLRYAQEQGKWSWRTSVGYEDFESSDEAGAGRYEAANAALNNLIGFPGSYRARDFARNLRFDSEFINDYTDQTQISFGVGYTHGETGDWEFLGVYPMENGWTETVRPFTRINHTFEDGSSGYLQWFGNFQNNKFPSIMKWFAMENDVEAQYNFKAGTDHKVSMGGNFRFIRLDTEVHNTWDLMYPGEPFNEQLAGMFLIDRWHVNKRWTFESQVRGDWYSETQTDWSTRLTALHALDSRKDHMLRFSFAKAFRAPLLALRETRARHIAIGPNVHAFNRLPMNNLDNEETWALEAGYKGRISENLTLSADAYYQRFDKLIGFRISGLTPPISFAPDNIDGADTWGTEIELALERKKGRLSAWYAYNDFQEDTSGQLIRSYAPAQHKAGLTGRLFLDDGWTLNANYKFTNTTPVIGDKLIFDIGASHRLDLNIAKEFIPGRGEIILGVTDVFNETDGPNYAIGGLTAHETPGRTFFVQMQYRF